MKLVSFYTEDTPYEDLAHTFRESAESVGLDPLVFKAKNLGNWALNCSQKAGIIYQAYQMYPDDRILYVDIDATFEKYPLEIENHDTEFDIGFHKIRNNELLSGTLVFNHTFKACLLLRKWVQASKEHSTIWDQKILARVVDANSLKIYHLGPALCYIFDISKRLYPDVDPIILHHQASRRYRRAINDAGLKN